LLNSAAGESQHALVISTIARPNKSADQLT
jgi:hypothetical protein